jgi:hypothetical protein
MIFPPGFIESIPQQMRGTCVCFPPESGIFT